MFYQALNYAQNLAVLNQFILLVSFPTMLILKVFGQKFKDNATLQNQTLKVKEDMNVFVVSL